MLNFTGYDVGESRRLFTGELQASVSAAGQTSMHRSPGYLHGFADSCYDAAAANHGCPPPSAGHGQSLTGYPTYSTYRLPFTMSNAPAVYEEQKIFDRYNKPDLHCSASISAHGNFIRHLTLLARIRGVPRGGP